MATSLQDLDDPLEVVPGWENTRPESILQNCDLEFVDNPALCEEIRKVDQGFQSLWEELLTHSSTLKAQYKALKEQLRQMEIDGISALDPQKYEQKKQDLVDTKEKLNALTDQMKKLPGVFKNVATNLDRMKMGAENLSQIDQFDIVGNQTVLVKIDDLKKVLFPWMEQFNDLWEVYTPQQPKYEQDANVQQKGTLRERVVYARTDFRKIANKIGDIFRLLTGDRQDAMVLGVEESIREINETIADSNRKIREYMEVLITTDYTLSAYSILAYIFKNAERIINERGDGKVRFYMDVITEYSKSKQYPILNEAVKGLPGWWNGLQDFISGGRGDPKELKKQAVEKIERLLQQAYRDGSIRVTVTEDMQDATVYGHSNYFDATVFPPDVVERVVNLLANLKYLKDSLKPNDPNNNSPATRRVVETIMKELDALAGLKDLIQQMWMLQNKQLNWDVWKADTFSGNFERQMAAITALGQVLETLILPSFDKNQTAFVTAFKQKYDALKDTLAVQTPQFQGTNFYGGAPSPTVPAQSGSVPVNQDLMDFATMQSGSTTQGTPGAQPPGTPFSQSAQPPGTPLAQSAQTPGTQSGSNENPLFDITNFFGAQTSSFVAPGADDRAAPPIGASERGSSLPTTFPQASGTETSAQGGASQAGGQEQKKTQQTTPQSAGT